MGEETSRVPKVYFDKVALVTLDNPHRIDLIRAPDCSDVPKAMTGLIEEIDETARIISRVFADQLPMRQKLFENLYMTADLGLRGGTYNISAALNNIAELKKTIAEDFTVVRDDSRKQHARYTLLSLAIAVPGAVLFYAAIGGHWGVPIPNKEGTFNPYIAATIAFFLIPFGVAVGLFLEFSYSVDQELVYEKLLEFNPGGWRPWQRLFNTIITAYCFAAILASGAIQVGVLSVLLNDFITTRPLLSIATGFVAGFSFPFVRDLIYKFRPVQKQ